jgi:hypothetical protein
MSRHSLHAVAAAGVVETIFTTIVVFTLYGSSMT